MVDDVERQYQSTNPLHVRMRTHERYEERRIDLDAICLDALGLSGAEAILDVGCGPGQFLGRIARAGHQGRLVGLDQSEAMVADVMKLSEKFPTVEAYRGDAQALAFPDDSFERVIARHMLYHVPGILIALGEMRRVLSPGGRLLVTTNSERSLPRILDLIQDLLAAFGLPPWERPDARFSIENASVFLAAAGFDAEARVIDNALVFHQPGPIAAYAASVLPSLDVQPGSARHAEMERWLTTESASRLTALGGIWRDPKQTGVYVGE